MGTWKRSKSVAEALSECALRFFAQLVASHFQVLAMTCVLENRETSAMTSYVLHGAKDGVVRVNESALPAAV